MESLPLLKGPQDVIWSASALEGMCVAEILDAWAAGDGTVSIFCILVRFHVEVIAPGYSNHHHQVPNSLGLTFRSALIKWSPYIFGPARLGSPPPCRRRSHHPYRLTGN